MSNVISLLALLAYIAELMGQFSKFLEGFTCYWLSTTVQQCTYLDAIGLVQLSTTVQQCTYLDVIGLVHL